MIHRWSKDRSQVLCCIPHELILISSLVTNDRTVKRDHPVLDRAWSFSPDKETQRITKVQKVQRPTQEATHTIKHT